ncbi:MAG: SCP2 sterol-binding domain-containing protein [Chitinophagales bacterium]|nr:SCP2 sterol-binding domain-containing protein [Chitinophagales bacterium]
MKAAEMIKSFEKRVDTESMDENEKSIFHFILSGENGGDFTVELKHKKIKVSEGLKGKPDCEVKAKASDYEALENGDLSPQWAFVTGKVKVSNVSELLKFKSYFKQI